MKTPRKHTKDNLYTGTVGNVTILSSGRTKREAIKRLRKLFAAQGVPTLLNTLEQGDHPSTTVPAYVDRLIVAQDTLARKPRRKTGAAA